MDIGFIGLGIMGRPMAEAPPGRRPQRDRVEPQPGPGSTPSSRPGRKRPASAKDVAAASEVVFTMVGDSPDVEGVALGPSMASSAAPRPGLIHIDMTTISPAVTR